MVRVVQLRHLGDHLVRASLELLSGRGIVRVDVLDRLEDAVATTPGPVRVRERRHLPALVIHRLAVAERLLRVSLPLRVRRAVLPKRIAVHDRRRCQCHHVLDWSCAARPYLLLTWQGLSWRLLLALVEMARL